jgi:hypothetical protein
MNFLDCMISWTKKTIIMNILIFTTIFPGAIFCMVRGINCDISRYIYHSVKLFKWFDVCIYTAHIKFSRTWPNSKFLWERTIFSIDHNSVKKHRIGTYLYSLESFWIELFRYVFQCQVRCIYREQLWCKVDHGQNWRF